MNTKNYSPKILTAVVLIKLLMNSCNLPVQSPEKLNTPLISSSELMLFQQKFDPPRRDKPGGSSGGGSRYTDLDTKNLQKV